MNQYISLFTLFGSLTALFVLSALLYKKKLTREALPLALLVLFLSIRAYRDFQVFLPGNWSDSVKRWIYFLSDTTLLLPYLTFVWLSLRAGINKRLKWQGFLPYLYQLVMATSPYWIVFFPPEQVYPVIRSYRWGYDLIIVALTIYYGLKCAKLRFEKQSVERLVAFGVLVALVIEVMRMRLLFLLVKWDLGFTGVEMHTVYLVIKSALIFFMAYLLFQTYQNLRDRPFIKPKNVIMADQSSVELFLSRKLFLEHDITVATAARSLKVSRNVLSKTIAENGFKNFIEFVNEYRLDHFLAMVEEEAHLKLSIMGMAESSGFKSKATFNRVFKAKMGLTPSVYINQKNTVEKPVAVH